MIQILISWQGDWELIDAPYNSHITVSEVVNGWLILLNEPDEFDELETQLEEQNDVFIIGSYNMDGSQYTYGNPKKNEKRKHTITKYSQKLHPKKVYNDSGELVSETPYDETTALNKQVNLIYGHNKRILD